MLSTDQINDLHRLYWSEHWPIRKIERHLRMSWRTIKKYLDAPAQGVAQPKRESKLDPFKATIGEWLEKDPSATAAVIEQRLQSLGYNGGLSPGVPEVLTRQILFPTSAPRKPHTEWAIRAIPG